MPDTLAFGSMDDVGDHEESLPFCPHLYHALSTPTRAQPLSPLQGVYHFTLGRAMTGRLTSSVSVLDWASNSIAVEAGAPLPDRTAFYRGLNPYHFLADLDAIFKPSEQLPPSLKHFRDPPAAEQPNTGRDAVLELQTLIRGSVLVTEAFHQLSDTPTLLEILDAPLKFAPPRLGLSLKPPAMNAFLYDPAQPFGRPRLLLGDLKSPSRMLLHDSDVGPFLYSMNMIATYARQNYDPASSPVKSSEVSYADQPFRITHKFKSIKGFPLVLLRNNYIMRTYVGAPAGAPISLPFLLAASAIFNGSNQGIFPVPGASGLRACLGGGYPLPRHPSEVDRLANQPGSIFTMDRIKYTVSPAQTSSVAAEQALALTPSRIMALTRFSPPTLSSSRSLARSPPVLLAPPTAGGGGAYLLGQLHPRPFRGQPSSAPDHPSGRRSVGSSQSSSKRAGTRGQIPACFWDAPEGRAWTEGKEQYAKLMGTFVKLAEQLHLPSNPEELPLQPPYPSGNLVRKARLKVRVDTIPRQLPLLPPLSQGAAGAAGAGMTFGASPRRAVTGGGVREHLGVREQHGEGLGYSQTGLGDTQTSLGDTMMTNASFGGTMMNATGVDGLNYTQRRESLAAQVKQLSDAALERGMAFACLNTVHLDVEAQSLRRTVNAATAQIRRAGALMAARSFEPKPNRVDFGVVVPGQVRRKTLLLSNMGIEHARFRLHRPLPPGVTVHIQGKARFVPPGLSAALRVEYRPPSDASGRVSFTLVIRSELELLAIPLYAMVPE
eukprot:gnl/Dysnectes_brevis/5461_a7864_519.p1 GENE.gnl/Dysnectes_brevis/5461_a7864_519~~gnl/Dysnectes_brevis/5461_a7864_519.p1  ORF type:complete len:909 (-),score=155.52 gnl/Dysnectes_brevis/5461_a7864_519:68-2389(-)